MRSMISSTLIAGRNRIRHSAGSARSLAAAELLSFLEQARAAIPWTERDYLSDLRERIRDTNNNRNALHKSRMRWHSVISSRMRRVESTTVGIRLLSRDDDPKQTESAHDRAAEATFLKQLRGTESKQTISEYLDLISQLAAHTGF